MLSSPEQIQKQVRQLKVKLCLLFCREIDCYIRILKNTRDIKGHLVQVCKDQEYLRAVIYVLNIFKSNVKIGSVSLLYLKIMITLAHLTCLKHAMDS